MREKAYAAAFSDSGKYGKWIREHMEPLLVLGNNAFAHAAISPQVAKYGLKEATQTIYTALHGVKVVDNWLTTSNGPLWDRRMAKGDCQMVYEAIDILNVDRIIIAHTVQQVILVLFAFVTDYSQVNQPKCVADIFGL